MNATKRARWARKKARLEHAQRKAKKLRQFAAKLNETLCNSEKWFQELYKPYTKFLSIGYDVIRIKAYNTESFEAGMKRIAKIKGPHFTPGRVYTEAELKDFRNKYNCKVSN